MEPTCLDIYWNWFALEVWRAFSFRQICYILCDQYSRGLGSSPD